MDRVADKTLARHLKERFLHSSQLPLPCAEARVFGVILRPATALTVLRTHEV